MLDEPIKATLKDACRKLTGPKKRAFMAGVALDYFEGSARKTESHLGWGRKGVELGLEERRSGLVCQDNYRARGNRKTESKQPALEADIRELLAGQAQADPQMKTTFRYLKVSAPALRAALIAEKGYSEASLPTRQTLGTMLNRMGYCLKKSKR